MAAIDKTQTKRLYALGAGLGIVERGNKDDDFHALVYSLAGKTSVSELTVAEFTLVERELLHRMRLANLSAPLKSGGRKRTAPETAPGMMTAAQQGLAWRMIYRLQELDTRSATATPGERMQGAIRKILGIEATLEKPFAWICMEDGSKLVEALKRYVRSAERKKEAV